MQSLPHLVYYINPPDHSFIAHRLTFNLERFRSNLDRPKSNAESHFCRGLALKKNPSGLVLNAPL